LIDALVEGARRSALDELADLTLAPERVLVFWWCTLPSSSRHNYE
jgi:hypothetical protein